MISRLKPPRLRATPRNRWRVFLEQVEPRLAVTPRVHRFARPPLLGAPELPADPLAVWIEGGGDLAARTRASVQAGTRPPTRILDGPLATALAAVRDERVVLLRAGDELAPLALERLGQVARMAPDAAVITADSDQLGPGSRRRAPRLRPGPSPDHWLADDACGPLLTADRRLALELAGELGAGPGWWHELALRLAGPASARHAHVPMLLCHQRLGHGDRPGLSPAGLERILGGWEPGARAQMAGDVRWVRRPVSREVSVEVIICFRDRAELLKRCVGSLLAITRWERLSVVLIDNGSIAVETEAELRRLSVDPHVRVLQDPRPFNFAALNNAWARSSRADVIVFLNNDTETVDEDWIAVLLEEALRPEIGAVAPLLLYPDGKVQHAGAAIGLHGYAGHPFAGLSAGADTPFGRADAGTRNWLAVTAACLMVERAKFAAVGGFDESFVVAGNDVDLGLRLTAAGHRSLCVPHTRLVHDESRSRGVHVDPGDFAASERSYGRFRTVGDPFYNPNLTLSATDCRLRAPSEL
jgi:GT2 family glycosyltransferase